MKKYNAFCGFGKRSETLEGAISPCMDFFYIAKVKDEWGIEEKDSFKSIIQYIDEDFDADYINDIILYNDMAVLEAYNLREEEDLDYAKLYIMLTNQDKYREYDLQLVEKAFPLDVISGFGEEPQEVEMSTHIICIKNYKELIEKAKTKTK